MFINFLGDGFKGCCFHPYPWGNGSNLTNEHIFQRGWFNHQLVVVVMFGNTK